MTQPVSADFLPYLNWIDAQQEAMVADLIRVAEINSGSYHTAGVNQVAETFAELAAGLGGDVSWHDLPPQQVVNDKGELTERPLGRALQISKRPEAPLRVFLCGHLDTVFPKDSSFQQVRWLDDNTLNGPGVADLKGGLVLMLRALQAFENSPWAEQLGWDILFNPDEEIGSPGSSALFPHFAERTQVGLLYEPAYADGNLAGERKGSGNFSVVVRGRAAHAGREHHLGRNAIRALADFTSALDDLNGQRAGVTINPGYVTGGGPVNIVPDLAVMKFNIRLEKPEDEDWCWQHIHRLQADINSRDGLTLEVHGGFGRKPKVLSPANLKLAELVRECGQSLGLQLEFKPTGGCCDGNNLAACGLPNIDTLGIVGGKIHSHEEYARVDTLAERSKLTALILLRLATDTDRSWLQPCAGQC
ncbi:acetylornithine deacetylase [Pokkaliibacter plantistimulans]|uniref:Acetylornithine deacetylase n=1 Tax=Pokkaliibacter plantistimulans TaxID=1635171 RepID=A0ABX5LW91_9GAMM|nr:hydrolase [Pokkaliibacter plantistimulans]PXF29733.1 acetylornithine deacetylase [Pokkaliibacter plantistimulans]